MTEQEQTFRGWAIIELMGHRRVAGYVSEREVAGARFLQIEIPQDSGEWRTQLYAPQAVYCITPVTEQVARALARHSRPLVVNAWELDDLVQVDRLDPDDGEDDEDEWGDGP